MSAQSAEQRFRSITTIIKDLRMAGLWLEEGTGWDRAKSDKGHLNPVYKKDIHMLDSLCNTLVRSPGDVVAALIAVHQSGAELVVAESSPCVLATNSKEPKYQAPGVAIKHPSDYGDVVTFVLEHVRRFKSDNEKISFKNHANIITSLLRKIYDPEDENPRTDLLFCYVLGMSLPKTIDRLYAKKAGLPQYVELFKTQFRRELLADRSVVLHVEDKHINMLRVWAENLLETDQSTSCYTVALEQLKMVNQSSMQLTEEIAAVVHDIIYTLLSHLFGLRMARLDQDSLLAAIQAQLSLSMFLSQLKPFIQAYLRVIDSEKYQPISQEESSCAIIDGEEEEEEEEGNEIKIMNDDRKPWSEICFHLLKRIALIASSTLLISLPGNAHPGLNRLLKSSSVTAIEPGHHDMKMEHWEDTVDYLLKDTDDVDSSILKDNLRKIVCKTTPLVFKNVKKEESMKAISTNTLKFTGAYHCELALMALFLRAKSEVQCPKDGTSTMEPRLFQKVQSVKLGLSKPCCLICNFVICRIKENDSRSSVSYSGHHNHVYPCTLPDDLPEAVLFETREWVETLLRNHLTSSTFQLQMNSHFKSFHLKNGSTASKETDASISPEVSKAMIAENNERFFRLPKTRRTLVTQGLVSLAADELRPTIKPLSTAPSPR